MSDRMHCIPFRSLLDWVLGEWEESGSVFGCKKLYRAGGDGGLRPAPFMGRFLETPIGPAAGPNTQLAQNIAASYVCGGRMFELKTVQIIDGEDLHVSKPCILAEDEGYNCEWSTELTVQQAFDEYIKAWFLLHLLAKELSLGRQDGFVFNMSVGYDLAGIKSEKIDRFIEGLKDASGTEIWQKCRAELLEALPRCKYLTAADVEAISPNVCSSITLSTMHGCPAGEIEGIASYLMEVKGLNLYLKCNPTLLGYEYARKALDDLGFTDISFGREQFESDLQYADAVPMLGRLREKAAALGLAFGVKLTNTFPVQVLRGELPDEAMYMSGRTLLPLSLGVAAALTREFDGELPISYCGGANAQNMAELYAAGLMPITVCTDILKPGGYHRLNSMALALEKAAITPPPKPDAETLERLAKTLCGPAGAVRNGRKRKSKAEFVEFAPLCKTVCGSCATLCPNRANVVIPVEGRTQMLHIDGMCNECGNCASFCPEKHAPYLEKLTLFCSAAEMAESRNSGFAPVNAEKTKFAVRLAGESCEYELGAANSAVPAEIAEVIEVVAKRFPWLMYD